VLLILILITFLMEVCPHGAEKPQPRTDCAPCATVTNLALRQVGDSPTLITGEGISLIETPGSTRHGSNRRTKGVMRLPRLWIQVARGRNHSRRA
jgi:hypothetical protein